LIKNIYNTEVIMQAEISQWLGQVATLLPFGYAFGAGMVSAVNPCGFTMLPVYLTLYLGAQDQTFRDGSFLLRLFKAVWIATVVTSGFGLLFGAVGVAVSAGGSYLMAFMPWIALVVGALLFLLGLAMLAGKNLSFAGFQSLSAKIGDPRDISVRGFFLFGLAFGAASLGCTLPIFLMVVGSSLSSGNFLTGIWPFISYILGMGSIILLLTLGIAVLREGVVVRTLRRVMPWVQKISAVLLLLAGGYICYYWLTSGLLFP
jgi:cytochrome c biogenesis protein CcdA